jgi:hypothetical protein
MTWHYLRYGAVAEINHVLIFTAFTDLMAFAVTWIKLCGLRCWSSLNGGSFSDF